MFFISLNFIGKNETVGLIAKLIYININDYYIVSYILLDRKFCLISVDGQQHTIFCRNYTREEVNKWIELLKTQVGDYSALRFRKMWHTDHPSIQGPWTPFTFKDPALNLVEFPDVCMKIILLYQKVRNNYIDKIFRFIN